MSGHCLLKICKDKRHELSSYTISIYTTIPEFMIYSGLRRDSAKAYLDGLCQGEHPGL